MEARAIFDRIAVDPDSGATEPLEVARIDESACIGCTLCIAACPFDAIAGAGKRMHAILPSLCTGCALCVQPCPVDCISMAPASRVWTHADAQAARARYLARNARLARGERIAHRGPQHPADDASARATRRARVAAAFERARARRAAPKRAQ